MLEQSPKPSQFPDGLVVRFGDDRPAAEEQSPHILGNGGSGRHGLQGYSLVFLGGKPERPPLLKSGCRLPFFHLSFLPLESVRSEAPNAYWESRGEAFGRMLAGVRQLPSCKEELLTVFGTAFHCFGGSIARAVLPLLAQA